MTSWRQGRTVTQRRDTGGIRETGDVVEARKNGGTEERYRWRQAGDR